MKKILLFIALCFITISINAQNEILIHKSNDLIKLNTSEIDSIKFKTADNEMLIYTSDGEMMNVIRADVDSIKFAPIQQEEQPIVLTASVNSIVANGIEKVIFTVMQEDNDVTVESEIYVNDTKISGNQFSTLTPGSYTAYAKKNEVVSNEVTFTAEEAPATGKTIVFAEGVTTASGWYDVNKVGAGDNGDINMCWSASCANIIQWWQDRYVAAGNTLPEKAVTGPGAEGLYSNPNYKYQLALMDLFHSEWDNSVGGNVAMGIEWYFNGRNIEQYASAGSVAVPYSEGGYFKDIWESQILPNTYHDYSLVVVPGIAEFLNLISQEHNNYYIWGSGSGLNGIERLKKFSDLVVEFMSRGVTSLTISLNANGGLLHATTLWGYEIDNETGLLTKIWITDSDDLDAEPKSPILHECTVSFDEDLGKIKFSGIPRYGAFYPMSLCPVSVYGSR